MARSRRKYKQSRTKVRLGLPPRKPPKLTPNSSSSIALLQPQTPNSSGQWDEKGSLIENYRNLGIVNDPNLLGARSTCKQTVIAEDLQRPVALDTEAEAQNSSDVETDDLRSALGKKRKDGKQAPLQRLTKMQRIYISRLILKHGKDYQAMSKDLKLNRMQHPHAALEKLCKRFWTYEDLSHYKAT